MNDRFYMEGDIIVVSNPKTKHLTHGREYVVEWTSIGGYIAVRNDRGKIRAYSPQNYLLEKEIRNHWLHH